MLTTTTAWKLLKLVLSVLPLIALGGLLLLLLWPTITTLRRERERVLSSKSGSCWVVQILYDGESDRGMVTFRCPKQDGTTNDITGETNWRDLKDRVMQHPSP